ncbi:unnamed protein product [Leptidea sinapis]|uniref:FERM domain-containing protein n=1 Tax=Leptidea sinapis TaxID=189913 RepID=A0A5E4PR53_9NEOP|nr:unnamed protein product [Leptidea sinapis]
MRNCHKNLTLACRVVLLDERELIHEIQDTSTGQALLDVVFRHLDLLETAYFGLRYVDQDNQTHWLDAGKRLRRQLRSSDSHTFYFGVKFYATDPCKLLEEITRTYFVDGCQSTSSWLLNSRLMCFTELGDYEPRRHAPGYVSEFRLLTHQTPELEARAADIHRTLTSGRTGIFRQSEVARHVWFAPSGLLLLRGKHSVATYYWPRNDTSTYGFESPTRSACRHLWRCCTDHHTFFRLQQSSPASADIFTLGSRLRNSAKVRRHRDTDRLPHRHRSRRQQSDAESELSRGSGRSGRRHRRHRSRHKHDSASERDESQPEPKEYELVDSESQWKEVLRQTTGGAGGGVQVASVRRSHVEPEIGTHRSSHRPRRHKKHRSRSGSPNDKKWLPNELKQHLEFSLVDTAGMTEEQLKEIPYTVVQTSQARHTKLRTSSKHKQNEQGSMSRREKAHKGDHDNHGSVRSSSSILSVHRTNIERHGRRVYPCYDDPMSHPGDDFLTNNGYKGSITTMNNNPYSPVNNSNSNSSSGELISGSARVSHEHTDSGLGADQDYAYSSESAARSAQRLQLQSN